MRKLRVYIDTSVIGGCFDDEFMEWSTRLFDEFIEGKKIALISDLCLEELSEAPKFVRTVIDKIPPNYINLVYKSEESTFLANEYIRNGAITPKSSDDALHIAIATTSNADLLVSWNFKHIVNYVRIVKYNAINLLHGFKSIEIRNPKEVVDYEEDL